MLAQKLWGSSPGLGTELVPTLPGPSQASPGRPRQAGDLAPPRPACALLLECQSNATLPAEWTTVWTVLPALVSWAWALLGPVLLHPIPAHF